VPEGKGRRDVDRRKSHRSDKFETVSRASYDCIVRRVVGKSCR
jgi:hypothetical protein